MNREKARRGCGFTEGVGELKCNSPQGFAVEGNEAIRVCAGLPLDGGTGSVGVMKPRRTSQTQRPRLVNNDTLFINRAERGAGSAPA